MKDAARAFGFPFRPGWGGSWVGGIACLLLLPLAFPLLFGYVVEAVRSAGEDPGAGPPAWRINARLVSDGLWSSAQFAALAAPFGAAAWAASSWLTGLWAPAHDPFLDRGLALVAAGFLAALAWGMLALVVVPPTLARFAVSGRPADLADVAGALRLVRSHFADWNLAVVVIVTSWIVAIASGALVCGVIGGLFYAILVSAHACSALAPDQPPRR